LCDDKSVQALLVLLAQLAQVLLVQLVLLPALLRVVAFESVCA
jgi:hypothetical protein